MGVGQADDDAKYGDGNRENVVMGEDMERAYRPCAVRSCPNVTRDKYCEEHAHLTYKTTRRESAAWVNWYKDKRYQRMRLRFLAAHPYCAICGEPATDLDHIIPHRGDRALFWDTDNWQGLCDRCHSRKTVEDNGGIGKGGVG